MTFELLEMPDGHWKRAAIGGVSGGVGFLIAWATVGGGDSLRLAVVTGVATLVLMVVLNAVAAR